MLDQSKITIFHKLFIVVLVLYFLIVFYRVSINTNDIIDKLKKSLLKTRLWEYIFLISCLSLLGIDYFFNKKLTHHEKNEIYRIIHLSIIITLTALFAHLDLYVIPAMVSLLIWAFSR